jgi:cystinosin
VSDLAFALHALVLSAATFVQAAWYFYRARQARLKPTPFGETDPLLGYGSSIDLSKAPTAPSLPTRIALAAMAVAALWQITNLTLGRTMFLDFLYFASSIKLLVSGYIWKQLTLSDHRVQVPAPGVPQPQAQVCPRLCHCDYFHGESTVAEGCFPLLPADIQDLTGGILSLVQLVISAVFIDHAPSGIWANPGKLGLSLLTLV